MKSLKILLVEDNPDDEFLTLRILAKLGQTDVTVVHQGGEALEYLFGDSTNYTDAPVINRPDLILLDMRMPLVDGVEFLESAHANLITNQIPVIVLSSSRQPKDVDRCSELGAITYLNKPVDASELKQAISTCTGSS